MMQNLLDLNRLQLVEMLAGWGQPRYRADQVWSWLYKKLATRADEMTNLPAHLRERLAAEMVVDPLQQIYEQRSADQHTVKWLFRLQDGGSRGSGSWRSLTVETVLMRYDQRRTVCISTQVGCAMGCVFCATGQAGLARNLTPGEIVAQVLHAQRSLMNPSGQAISAGDLSAFSSFGSLDALPSAEFPNEQPVTSHPPSAVHHLTNIVIMGMGEPFANYEATWQALRTLTDPDAFGLGARHITVSTVGLPQGIRKMAAEPLQVNLAVSLHAPDDALRSKLLPINRRYPIAEVMDAIREYIAATNRRVTFEYAMMAGINDTPELAVMLAALLRPLRSPAGGVMCHVNLIPLNPVAESPYQPSTPEAAAAFQGILERGGIPATVRMRRGVDIDAGCGQLRRRVSGSVQ